LCIHGVPHLPMIFSSSGLSQPATTRTYPSALYNRSALARVSAHSEVTRPLASMIIQPKQSVQT
jgi:hypothetical protein